MIKLWKHISKYSFNQKEKYKGKKLKKKIFPSFLGSLNPSIIFFKEWTHNKVNITCYVTLKWMQTTMNEKKMCACPSIKNSWQKCSVKSHNLCEKNTILHNFNILILWSTLILVLCLKHIISIGLLLNS